MAGATESAVTLNFMTFNVRHDHHDHSPTLPFAAPPAKEDPFNVNQFAEEQPWSIRKWKIADTILLYSPDVIGLQVSRGKRSRGKSKTFADI